MTRYFPTIEQFRSAASARPVVIPVYRQFFGDRLTPVAAFELLSTDDHAFLLESVVGGEKIGRYSFIATAPVKTYQVIGGRAISRDVQTDAETFTTTDPLSDLARMLPTSQLHRDANLPAFTGGLVGFAAYDLARYAEPEKLNQPPADDRQLPDALFGLYRELVIFDHVNKTLKVVSNAFIENTTDVEQAYQASCMRVDAIVARLAKSAASELNDIDSGAASSIAFESNMSADEFCEAVRKAQSYIAAGDIFQVVPSQRLRVRSHASPLDVYRALRVINPSPYMLYLKSPACTLIGSSPEILCRVQDGVVTTRPLAGTRSRGATQEEDEALEAELLADGKERAEHIMLVDLHRNDIGRVCEIGSVKVDKVMSVERYSHVMHITSNVTGKLAAGKSAFDALRVSLPVGTVSGAPKMRAMQIIDELEPTRRGPYGGGVGYIDFAGNTDICIALRTIVWRDGVFDVQCGAGVVAESVPIREYEETMNKAKALLKAVELAERVS